MRKGNGVPINDIKPKADDHEPSQKVNEFAEKHGVFETHITIENKQRQKNTAQIPLDFYANRGFISADQKTAGEQLLDDFSHSGIICRSRCLLMPSTGTYGGGAHAQLQAHQSYRRGMNSVKGVITQLIILNVVCMGEWLKDITHLSLAPEIDYLSLPANIPIENIPTGERMARLKRGLNNLVRHYEKTVVRKVMRQTATQSHTRDIPLSQCGATAG